MTTLNLGDIVKDNKNGKLYIVTRDHNRRTESKEQVEVSLFKNGKSWGTTYDKEVANLTLQK